MISFVVVWLARQSDGSASRQTNIQRVIIETYFRADLPPSIGADGYDPAGLAILELHAGSDLVDFDLRGSSFFITSPLHTPLDPCAMGIMQSLILRCALGVSKIAERTCAKDGGIEGEVELSESLGRAIFFALVLVLIPWLVFRYRSGGDRTSAFERLGCVMESETFGEGTLFRMFLRGYVRRRRGAQWDAGRARSGISPHDGIKGTRSAFPSPKSRSLMNRVNASVTCSRGPPRSRSDQACVVRRRSSSAAPS